MKIIVLGGGLVGGALAADLAADDGFDVTVADINSERLARLARDYPLKTVQADLADPRTVKRLAAEQELVVDAMPGFLGFRTFRAVIEAGKPVVDIAFFPEDPFQLDDLAREKQVTAIMDCGVAPGMSNILVSHAASQLDRVASALIYVGGLPVVREWPYEYKAVFSPVDVIEEYTRPARYVENGRLVTRPALSDPELLNFPGIGTLEAFNTDGLRTLIKTIDAPDMKEKTLRYPGHIAKMSVLRETGFFSTDPLEINGQRIRPLDFTAKLLFPKWELKPGEEDLTVMRIVVEGEKEGQRRRYRYDLYDRYDAKSGIHSMARTTGYTATATVRLLAAGLYDHKGVSPPEYIGRDARCVQFLLDDLKQKNIVYRETIEEIK